MLLTPVHRARGQNPLLSVFCPSRCDQKPFGSFFPLDLRFMVAQHKLSKYFADYQKGGKNTLEFPQVICRNKNNIHKLLGFRITRSRYGMVADYTWLWISGWEFNPVIFARCFYTTLKIFKVLCNNRGVFKSVHEDVVLLPTAFSWPEYFFSSPVCYIL